MKVLTFQILINNGSEQESRAHMRESMMNLEMSGKINDWWEKHPNQVPDDNS